MSEITVHKYEPKYRDEWDSFVEQSNNGTMFHKQAFLEYHPEGKFNFYHLMFRKGKELVAVLPGGIENNGKVFWSPVGASYGSIVTKDIRFELCIEIVDEMMKYFKRNNFREIYLIPAPIIYQKNYSKNLEYAMLYRKFDFELHYISHSIDLKHGKDFLKYFDKTARKTIHKIFREKKISIRESEDYENFHKILTENKKKHNTKPTHSLEDLQRLRELMPEHLHLNLVYYGNEPIAGSLLFLTNSKVALCFYNMLLYEYEKLKPMYLIMYETVRWAVENGYEWVDIGVSQETKAKDPMTPAMSLIHFKERFNSRGILRSTYHYKFED